MTHIYRHLVIYGDSVSVMSIKIPKTRKHLVLYRCKMSTLTLWIPLVFAGMYCTLWFPSHNHEMHHTSNLKFSCLWINWKIIPFQGRKYELFSAWFHIQIRQGWNAQPQDTFCFKINHLWATLFSYTAFSNNCHCLSKLLCEIHCTPGRAINHHFDNCLSCLNLE